MLSSTSVAIGSLAMAPVAAYVLLPAHREVLSFTLGAVGAAAAILSVIYLGTSIRESVRSELWKRTFEYHERWSDDRLRESRELLSKAFLNDGPAMIRIVRDSPDTERAAIALMNYFEEMALAIRVRAVDEDILVLYFKTPVLRAWLVLEPWVHVVREIRAPSIYREVEALYRRWEVNATPTVHPLGHYP